MSLSSMKSIFSGICLDRNCNGTCPLKSTMHPHGNDPRSGKDEYDCMMAVMDDHTGTLEIPMFPSPPPMKDYPAPPPVWNLPGYGRN